METTESSYLDSSTSRYWVSGDDFQSVFENPVGSSVWISASGSDHPLLLRPREYRLLNGFCTKVIL